MKVSLIDCLRVTFGVVLIAFQQSLNYMFQVLNKNFEQPRFIKVEIKRQNVSVS